MIGSRQWPQAAAGLTGPFTTCRLLVNGEYDGPEVPYVRKKTFLPVTRCGHAQVEYYVGAALVYITPVSCAVAAGNTVTV